MIDLYYWPTPNGHKITLFLEEAGSITRSSRSTSAPVINSIPSSWRFLRTTACPRSSTVIPLTTAKPVTVFESGAILLYLAEKTGLFLPTDLRGRKTTTEWLFWQMGGLGPMAGQNHHFGVYAPEKIPYAINRYVNETNRLYGVMDRRLADRPFLVGDAYTIADMAAYPWIVPWKRQQQNLDDFVNLRRWFDASRARPGTQRAYAKGEPFSAQPAVTEEGKKLLFGQTAASVAKS